MPPLPPSKKKEISNQQEEFDKMIEITSRCIDYYQKFIDEKKRELLVVDDAFKGITESLD